MLSNLFAVCCAVAAGGNMVARQGNGQVKTSCFGGRELWGRTQEEEEEEVSWGSWKIVLCNWPFAF